MAKAKKLPSGKWRCKANYTNEEGEYCAKSFTADTKKEAELLASQFLMEYTHVKKPENKTLLQLAETFIENRSNLLSPSTIIGYTKIKNTAFKSIVNVRIGLLTKEMYQGAINEYSKGRRAKTVLSAHIFFNHILKENNIHVGEGAILPQKQKKELTIPTKEQVNAILERAKGKEIYLAILLGARLGLSRSEILGLTWDCIDMEKGTITIKQSKVKNIDREYVIKEPKTVSRNRTLSLPTAIKEELEKRDKSQPLFTMNPSQFTDRYRWIASQVGAPLGFHTVRHFNASVMLDMNVPTKYAMERMGHSTDNMLKNVYQHTNKNKHEEIAKDMDAFFDGEEKKEGQ